MTLRAAPARLSAERSRDLRAVSLTRRRVASEIAMPGASLSTNPAVARDTPAAAATSRSVTRFSLIVTLRLGSSPDHTGTR